eukprot:6085543-Prymnesium_polylepis.1
MREPGWRRTCEREAPPPYPRELRPSSRREPVWTKRLPHEGVWVCAWRTRPQFVSRDDETGVHLEIVFVGLFREAKLAAFTTKTRAPQPLPAAARNATQMLSGTALGHI